MEKIPNIFYTIGSNLFYNDYIQFLKIIFIDSFYYFN
jgi:hypothetical protein